MYKCWELGRRGTGPTGWICEQLVYRGMGLCLVCRDEALCRSRAGGAGLCLAKEGNNRRGEK